MSKKRISVGVVIALMAITATLTLTLTYQYAMNRFNDQVKNITQRQKMYSRLYQLDTYAREFFLFPVDDNTIHDAIAEGYVNGLGDDSTRYLPQSQALKAQNQLEGMETGIGMEYAMYGSTQMRITRLINGAPAQLAGLQTGDFLDSINGVKLDGTWTEAQVAEALAGDAGTEVMLTVQRANAEGIPETLSFTITRKQYTTQTVTAKVINGNGYIRIYSFSEYTDDEFEAALIQMVNEGVTGLVIDVRNNGGGVLESAARIADQLVPAGTIASYVDKSGEKKVLYTSGAGQTDLPIMVLINQNSASAAELLAAAVKDYGKGRILGTQSRGKGTIQELHTFSDGSGLYLTTAYFYPPFSNSFDKVGITPDIKVEMPYTGSLDLLDPTIDVQLNAAVLLLNQSSQFNPTNPGDGTTSGDTSSEGTGTGDTSSGETTSGDTSSESTASGVSSQAVGYAPDCADCQVA